MDENLRLIIVGHVDHGKSTLIGRLLYDTGMLPEEKIAEIKSICDSLGKDFEFGYITDNLEEERGQGVTIDIAHIFFKAGRRRYTIIDAPGHAEFIKNMITGATQAEAAILIVDTEEGAQQQTRRHAYILKMLGLKQIVVAINKMDLVDHKEERFKEVKNELIEFLDKIDIKPAYIIPISAKKGEFVVRKTQNMQWYDGPPLLEALNTFNPHNSNANRPLRFSVQDVYKYDKRIVVGRVESGVLKRGEEVIVLPSNERTHIATIEEFFKEDVAEAETGKATGVVIKDKLFLERGNIISTPQNLPKVTDKFKAHIFWMDKSSLKKGERIILKCSTQQTLCKIEEFERILDSSTLEEVDYKEEIKNRQAADVILKTDKPLVVENFNEVEELGRFILERLNACAGGIITEV